MVKDKPKPHGHSALRLGRSSCTGQQYLVTTVTDQRRPIFDDWTLCMTAARAVSDPRLWHSNTLLAWVLMPDHWHGLIELGDEGQLANAMRAVKTNVARQVRMVRPDLPRVWARSYHDRALRADESTLDVARYVVLNPVRAGLARRVGDYPFWNAVWL